jgi:hypothetical protein
LIAIVPAAAIGRDFGYASSCSKSDLILLLRNMPRRLTLMWTSRNTRNRWPRAGYQGSEKDSLAAIGARRFDSFVLMPLKQLAREASR